MGMQASGNLGKTILIIINIIFLVVGLGFMSIGIILRIDVDELFTDEIIALLNLITIAGTINLGDLLAGLSIYVILLGVFIILIAAAGFLGAVFEFKPLLIGYVVLVLTIFVAHCVALALWCVMKNDFEDAVRTELFAALDIYDGTDATDDESKGLDQLQLKLKCCGSNKISASENDMEFQNSKWYKNKRARPATEKVPTSCCKNANSNNYKALSNTPCTDDLTDSNEKGCYEALKEETEDYQTAAIIVGCCLILIEVLAAAFTILLLCSIPADKMVDC